MRPLIITLCTLALWLTSLPAPAQIIVPTEIKRDTFGVAKIQLDIPEKATRRGKGWETPPGLTTEEPIPGTLYFVGPPGTYKLAYHLKWLWIEPVEFTDNTGKLIKLNNYLGDGEYDYEATVTIVGGDDPNPPQPPGPQPGVKKQVVIFYESNETTNLPPGQIDLLNSLVAREEIAQAGHSIRAVLDNNSIRDGVSVELAPFVTAVKKALSEGQTLPLIVTAPRTGGKILGVSPLPANATELITQLNK